MNVSLDFCFIKVLRVLHKLMDCLHAWYPDSSITVAVITSSNDCHDFLDGDFVGLLVDYSPLFNLTAAEQAHLVNDWAQWGMRRCNSHSSYIGDHNVAKVISSQAHRWDADTEISCCIRHGKT